jgi:hypothetical protein
MLSRLLYYKDFLASRAVIRNKQKHFTTGTCTGLKIQRIQELGSQIPVTFRSFYAYNEHIRKDEGWYFEKTEGWVFDCYNDEYTYKSNNHTKNAYYGSAYSLEYSSSGHRDQVRPSNDPRTWSTLLWSAHTHPFDGLPSGPDLHGIYNDSRRPVYTWGWKGTDGFIMNGVISPIYFLRFY